MKIYFLSTDEVLWYRNNYPGMINFMSNYTIHPPWYGHMFIAEVLAQSFEMIFHKVCPRHSKQKSSEDTNITTKLPPYLYKESELYEIPA